MSWTYKRLGDYIRLVDRRNTDLRINRLVGLSITKEFIASVANIVGADMARYKLIKRGQFACSLMQVRRDKKMPVAMLNEYEEAIISQAYPVFEVVDENSLLPEYLMMWMSRSEFDRHACFLAVGGVRGSLEWDDFCDMQLPIPSIEKQKEVVKEYNTIVDRIKLNEELNQKLEETAQAIYKNWFIDFEFPISAEYAASIGKPELEGQPYKSNGGEMVWNEELEKEVPKGWRTELLGEVITSYSKSHDFEKDELIFFNTSDILEGDFLHNNYRPVKSMPGQAKKRIAKGDILFSEIRPKNKRYALVRVDVDDYVVSTKLMVLRLINTKFNQYRLYHFLTNPDFIDELQKSAEGRSGTFPQITFELDIEKKTFLVGDGDIESSWQKFLQGYYQQYYARKDELMHLQSMAALLLTTLTKTAGYEGIVLST